MTAKAMTITLNRMQTAPKKAVLLMLNNQIKD